MSETVSNVERIRNILLDDLQEGRIKPGEAFPPERKMADRLGVSRHTLRQAFTSLKSLGLIDIKPGSGAYAVESVSDAAVMRVAEALIDREGSIYKILEVRESMEPGMARMAAERRSDEDLARLEKLIEYLPEDEQDEVGKESTSFHREIARATKNSVFDGVMRTLITGPRRAEGLIKVVPTARIEWENEHQAIFDAIKNKDAELAEKLMREHMQGILLHVRELEETGKI